MADWYEKLATFTELDDTIVVGRPALVAYFYSHGGLENHAQAVFDSWRKLMTPVSKLYYSHDKTKRILALTSKEIEKMRSALAKESIAKGDEYKFYYAKSGPAEGAIDECHGNSFEIYTTAGDNGYVYVAFPLDYVSRQGTNAVLDWFKKWCEVYEFTHAGVGFGYEVAWFGEQRRQVYPLMLQTALRYHGVRMFERLTAQQRVRSKETLDTVAWLTFLDKKTIEDLEPGAIDRIDSGVTRHPCGDGIVLQAGPEPDPCDVNRPSRAYELLSSVNAAIVPVRTISWWKNWFACDDPDKENGWFSRMDK